VSAARLAFEVAAANAWEWKGKKKSRKSKKDRGAPPQHPLVRAPVLRANDGTQLSVADLIDAQLNHKRVAVVRRGGTFLDHRRAWWPRKGEEDPATALGLTLSDETSQLEVADRYRARPVFERLDAPLDSAWRARLAGPGLEGEVALHAQPSGQLVVEVLHERRLLERWTGAHPIGGVARVESRQVSPEPSFTQARRDAAFKTLLAATEAALQRAVLARLTTPPAGLDAWTLLVLQWKGADTDALGGALAALPLFEDLGGGRLTPGAVRELARRVGKVPLARGVKAPEGQTVLLDGPLVQVALEHLGLKFEDVTEALLRKAELQSALTSRRLDTLEFKGEALVRARLSGALAGELALTLEGGGEVRLAKTGIPVQPFEHRWVGVAGVVELADLQVDESWTRASVTRAHRALIAAEVDGLFAALAARAGELGDGERERATTLALGYLLAESEGGRVTLDRLEGGAKAVARAPLFLTGLSTRVSLEQLASAAGSPGRVAVFERGLGVPKAEVVVASSLGATWVAALGEVLGKNRVWKVTDRAAWEEHVSEADPAPGSPLARGLEQLRRNVRLLRSGALGRLTPEDLEDVKLKRAGGGRALVYDATRKLVLLDPEHPHVQRALGETGAFPERLWVLLAAIFGAVNRALDHVTDEHEAQLALALAAHLAANPQLLEPSPRS
jgi:hypothetical protein